VLAWTRWNSAANQTELVGRRMSRTGSLGSPAVLGLGDLPDVALDDDGHGLVVWHSPGAQQDPTQVKARTIATAGTFGAVRTLSSDGRPHGLTPAPPAGSLSSGSSATTRTRSARSSDRNHRACVIWSAQQQRGAACRPRDSTHTAGRSGTNDGRPSGCLRQHGRPDPVQPDESRRPTGRRSEPGHSRPAAGG